MGFKRSLLYFLMFAALAVSVYFKRAEVIKSRAEKIETIDLIQKREGVPVKTKAINFTTVYVQEFFTALRQADGTYAAQITGSLCDALRQSPRVSYQGQLCKIVSLAADINMNSGLYEIVISFTQPPLAERIVVCAEIYPQENVYQIEPQEAVLTEGKYFIWTVKNDRASKMEIKDVPFTALGFIVNDKNFEQGTEFVSEGISLLKEDVLIKRVDDEVKQ